jgi:hypothetical protein
MKRTATSVSSAPPASAKASARLAEAPSARRRPREFRFRVLRVMVLSACAGVATFAQVGRGGSEWLTALGDAQRTSWIRQDAKISIETMSAPGFELQWTSKLDNQARGLSGLTQGVTANGVTLFVPMSVVAGSSNNVYGIDNDTGYAVWSRRFTAPMPAGTAACAGGITSAATRIVGLTPPPVTATRAGGAGRAAAGYRSVVGQPGEGVPVDANGVSAGRGMTPPPAPGAGRGDGGRAGAGPGRPGGGPGGGGRGPQPGSGIPGAPADLPGGGLARVSGVAYVVSSDGQLHVVGLPSGKDIQRPAPFLPANARWSDPIAVGTTMYAATSGGCGGAPSGVWAIDLESAAKPVVSWKTNGGGIVGAVAFTTDGTLIAAVGPGPAGASAEAGKSNAIVALDAKTLQIKDWFTQPASEFVTGPTIFRHNSKDIVAAATKDGRVLLLDAASLGGANHATPLLASQPVMSGAVTFGSPALSTWQEMTVAPLAADAPPNTAPTVTYGTRWILAPVNNTVQALKLVDNAGALSLQSAWAAEKIAAPAPPIIVNGVVFALSTGRPSAAGGAGSPAVLSAYHGVTGRQLYTSGSAMKTFASPGSFWSAMGQVYIGTHDGSLHAFGFLDERR